LEGAEAKNEPAAEGASSGATSAAAAPTAVYLDHLRRKVVTEKPSLPKAEIETTTVTKVHDLKKFKNVM
jgi:hypothetical protein